MVKVDYPIMVLYEEWALTTKKFVIIVDENLPAPIVTGSVMAPIGCTISPENPLSGVGEWRNLS